MLRPIAELPEGVLGFEATGEVDRRTWKRLRTMTRMPTSDEMFNRAGPALFSAGDASAEVRKIQARLRQIQWFFGDVTDTYGEQTGRNTYGECRCEGVRSAQPHLCDAAGRAQQVLGLHVTQELALAAPELARDVRGEAHSRPWRRAPGRLPPATGRRGP